MTLRTPGISASRPRMGVRLRARAFGTLLVLLTIAIGAVLLASVQSSALAEAMDGREALARVRANWAARAGVEAVLARLEYVTLNPNLSDAFAIQDDLADVAEGEVEGAIYRVSHTNANGREVLGPRDAHARLNINRMSPEALILIPGMTEDVAQSIIDWVDADDDTQPLGAEISYYQALPYPYEPRNFFIHHMQEVELIAGSRAEYVRGEDWNLNGRLDENENDGDESWPPDNRDGKLDGGWSGLLSAESIDDVLTPSGEERLDLRTAQAGDVVGRVGVSQEQAQAIVDYVVATPMALMRDFIRRDLRQLAAQGGQQGQPSNVQALSREQLAKLVDECGIDVETPVGPLPGKLNLNTCEATALEYVPGLDPALADAILLERDSRPQGFASIIDLLEVPGVSRRVLAGMYDVLAVRSNVYIVTCRGRDIRTGLEVEMSATLDRSTVPVVIRELRIR